MEIKYLELDEQEVVSLLSSDPGNSIFADYAELLRNQNRQEAAILVCIKGLSLNPACHRGRLVFARCLYELNCRPFSIEQIKYLSHALPDNQSLSRLLAKLSHGQQTAGSQASTAAVEDTIAEADFDFSEIDLLEEDKE